MNLTWEQISSPPMRQFFEVIVFLMGATVGSFLNVCIHRLPREISFFLPARSFCPSCKKLIRWYDNIPIMSYFVLRGRCRDCGVGFSARYMVVELLTAVLFLVIWKEYGWNNPFLAAAYLLFAAGCIVAMFVDLEHYLIPDVITIGGVMVGFLWSALWPSLHLLPDESKTAAAAASMMGILVGSGVILWIAIAGEVVFRKEAMGFGDVKLMGAVGAFLGWQAAVFTVFFGAVTGAAAGIVVKLVRWRAHKSDFGERYLDDAEVHYLAWGGQQNSSIPFGPFLILGALAWVLLQDQSLGPTHWNVRTWMAEQVGTFACFPEGYPCEELVPATHRK